MLPIRTPNALVGAALKWGGKRVSAWKTSGGTSRAQLFLRVCSLLGFPGEAAAPQSPGKATGKLQRRCSWATKYGKRYGVLVLLLERHPHGEDVWWVPCHDPLHRAAGGTVPPPFKHTTCAKSTPRAVGAPPAAPGEETPLTDRRLFFSPRNNPERWWESKAITVEDELGSVAMETLAGTRRRSRVRESR